MTACRVLYLLLALLVVYPAWAVPSVRWEQCESARPSTCRRIVPEHLNLARPITTISAIVTVPPNKVHEPLAVDIDGMASASVRWNAAEIGRNGAPGTNWQSETPGLFSFSVAVPARLVRPGENRVTITLSAHHLWLPIRQPLHRLAIGPPRDAEAYTLRHYLPTLATLAVPMTALLLLSTLLFAGRIGRPARLPMSILAVVIVQGLLEVSKVVLSYAYPWHLARMVALAGLTAMVGLLLVVLTCRMHLPTRTSTAFAITAAAMLLSCLFVSGLDRQALAAFEIALLAAAAAAAPAAMRRDGRAIALVAATVLLALWAQRAGPNFLDIGYYVAAAVAAVALIVTAVMQSARVVEIPMSHSTEPTVTLRDGARHHLVAPSRIVFLKAADDYCTLHLADGREIMVTATLKAILAILPSGFLRIHRGHAINARHLSGIRPAPNGRIAELADGTTLPVGRTYAAGLLTWVEENR